MIKELSLEENHFYNYFIEKEKIRRSEALKLFDNCDYSQLCKSYIHYLKTESKSIEIKDCRLDNAIEQLIQIKNELPKNTTSIYLNSYIIEDRDSIFHSEEIIIDVSWIEYSIENESKCFDLAKYSAKHSAWEMKNQPNGINGKKAIEIYKQLI